MWRDKSLFMQHIHGIFFFKKSNLRTLAGERSYLYTLDRRLALSSWEGRPLQERIQLREGLTWIGEGGRGHPPGQPDQPNQP